MNRFVRLGVKLGLLYLLYGAVMTAVHPQMLYPFVAEPFAREGYHRELVAAPDGPLWLEVTEADPKAPVILFFMGNAGALAWHEPMLALDEASGARIVAMEYPGGGGAPGQPSERLLKADALAAFDWVRATFPDAPVVLHGYSLGTGLALHVAARREAAGVMLDAPYAWLCQVMTKRSGLPACFMPFVQRWPSGADVPDVSEPVLVRHGTADEVIPYAQGEKLVALLGDRAEFVTLEGAHHGDLFRWPEYQKAGAAFLKGILDGG